MQQFEELQVILLSNDSHGYLSYNDEFLPSIFPTNIQFSRILGKPIIALNKFSKTLKTIRENPKVSFFFGNIEDDWAEVSGTVSFLPFIQKNFPAFVEARKNVMCKITCDEALVIVVLDACYVKIFQHGMLREVRYD
ncbi:Pyridoxamine 5'-phosphate oxidase domain-containing protein [Spironucleus salmonicida]|uniref:Pyridoxamine 5'-phosphate oxidase domain-containing protein n=1 Tax=Spironucleus salmonicida TaxID=348837 RepID=V6LJ66_9EUKA|nr:Pyridoxamine 5'-phosphate oxidase domain-containing protein [Spironucleus salmonicida]|eukprot:EST44388.1 Pyridoxamine 5'-phosphate oxidase domain-containing protein [Spironucleus salmonicida]